MSSFFVFLRPKKTGEVRHALAMADFMVVDQGNVPSLRRAILPMA